jgi:acetyl esterase
MSTARSQAALHPDSIELLRRAGELGLIGIEDESIEDARKTEVRERELMGARVAVAAVRDELIPGPEAALPVRVYTPDGEPPFPLLVFFHGGGWALGSIDQADLNCRALAARTGHVVVSVGYRLAPEHPFPAALEDCHAATVWADAEREELRANDLPLAVAGSSAGGNLAAAVPLIARDNGGPRIGAQLLLFPALDAAANSHSYDEFAEGYWLSANGMRAFWAHYLGGQELAENPYISPLLADDLSALPPALVITAEFDVLRDEGEAYAARLLSAGVPVRLSRYPGMLHSFWEYAGVIRHAAVASDEIAAALGTLQGIRWLEGSANRAGAGAATAR